MAPQPTFTLEQVASLLVMVQQSAGARPAQPAAAPQGDQSYEPDENGEFHCDPSDPNCQAAMRSYGAAPGGIATPGQQGNPPATPFGAFGAPGAHSSGSAPPTSGGGGRAQAGTQPVVTPGQMAPEAGPMDVLTVGFGGPQSATDTPAGDPRQGAPIAAAVNPNDLVLETVQRAKAARRKRRGDLGDLDGRQVPLGGRVLISPLSRLTQTLALSAGAPLHTPFGGAIGH